MIHEVEIHALKSGKVEKVGVIRWDDESGECSHSPANSPLLHNILKTPIRLAKNHEINSDDDPRTFIENLHKHYKSYALSATKVTGVPGPTANSYNSYEIPYAEGVE